MEKVLARISTLGDAYKGRALDKEKMLLVQRKLKLNNMPMVPVDFVELLHQYNSLSYDGSHLFGVEPRDGTDLDIVVENALINNTDREKMLILGFDDMDYLVWNEKEELYQTIDKCSFQMINKYKDCETALFDFLKLDDEYLR